MKRTPLNRSQTPMRRGRIKPKRDTPRRREAPRWDREEWEAANRTLMVRAAWYCECCGSPLDGQAVERHHRQRRRDGGDRLSNLLMLRAACHHYWTEHPAESVARGIIVPTHADPATTPVLWRGSEWSMLDDEGSRIRTALSPDWRIPE